MGTLLASIQILKDTNANLTGIILLDGQPAYDETNDVLVIGDGVTAFESLPKLRKSINTVFTGLISQSSTSDPTVIILENTTGATPTYSRIDVGVYGINATGLFTLDKTFCLINSGDNNYAIFRNSADQIRITTADGAGSATDGLLDKTEFEIRIYE